MIRQIRTSMYSRQRYSTGSYHWVLARPVVCRHSCPGKRQESRGLCLSEGKVMKGKTRHEWQNITFEKRKRDLKILAVRFWSSGLGEAKLGDMLWPN